MTESNRVDSVGSTPSSAYKGYYTKIAGELYFVFPDFKNNYKGDTDWFQVNLHGGYTYEISVGAYMSTYLSGIYNSQGRLIKSFTSDPAYKQSFTPSNSGTFYLAASDKHKYEPWESSRWHKYTLSGKVIEDSTDLKWDDRYDVWLTTGTPINSTLFGEEDIDYFSVSLTAGYTYTFTVDARESYYLNTFGTDRWTDGELLYGNSNEDVHATEGHPVTIRGRIQWVQRTSAPGVSELIIRPTHSGNYVLEVGTGLGSPLFGQYEISLTAEISNSYAPTAINLSSSRFDENLRYAVVGSLSVTDADMEDSHTLSLSGRDSDSFSIQSSSSGDLLKWASYYGADYETKSSYNITVTATDSGGLSKSKAFTIKVTDVYEAPKNTAPTAINLSSSRFDENLRYALVGSLSVTDADIEDSHTLSLSGRDSDSFSISSSSSGDLLKWASYYGADYETKSSYSIIVTATDSGGLSKSRGFTIKVTDEYEAPKNTAPTSITLSNNSIAENTPLALVGSLSVTDADANDSHKLTLSGQDANSFYISSSTYTGHSLKWKSNTGADYETKSKYSVIVTATDSGGLSESQPFTINVTDQYEAPKNSQGTDKTPPTENHNIFLGFSDNIVFQFNEEISRGSGLIKLGPVDANYELVSTVPISVDVSGSTLTIDPNYALKPEQNYFVVFYKDSILDLAGNDFNLNDDGSKTYYRKSLSVITTAVQNTAPTAQNTAPTAIKLSNNSIAENTPLALVGTLSVTDPDAKDSHKLTLSGKDAASFSISSSTYTGHSLKWKSSTGADYETKSSYNITVTATDSGGLSKSQQFTIKVTVIDEKTSTQRTLYGSSGNDILDDFSGYDIIDGKEGIDTVKYSVASDSVNYAVKNNSIANDGVYSHNQNELVISQTITETIYGGKYGSGTTSSSVQSETLTNIERLHFTDKAYALDLDGNAGIAAKVIIAALGAENLSTQMSSILAHVDYSATTNLGLSSYFINTGIIDKSLGARSQISSGTFVDHVYENVVGVAPSSGDHDYYTQLLDNGTYTQHSLLAMAANTTLTEALVTANSIDLIGVPGSADGEFLAIQYDIGLG